MSRKEYTSVAWKNKKSVKEFFKAVVSFIFVVSVSLALAVSVNQTTVFSKDSQTEDTAPVAVKKIVSFEEPETVFSEVEKTTLADIIKCELKAVPNEVQKYGEEITLNADVSGNKEGLSYKFVWMKDNWEKWGVIQDFSSNSTAKFTPESAGNYKLYLDVRDKQGRTYTSNIDYTVVTDVWHFSGITTDLKSPQEKYGDPIKISADTTGDISRLEYKFVWAKTDWSQWGVLQNFSSSSSAEWNPKEAGEYCLYVDVRDTDGRIVTKKIPYTITPVKWNFDTITFTPEKVKKGESVKVNVAVKGNISGLRYKFVWMKDNWKEWGVIQELSEKPNAEWEAPKKAGTYKLFVDVVDRDGVRVTKDKECTVLSQIWKQEEININNGEAGQVYTNIPVTTKVSGETENLSYKFVWMKDNWKEWGVIKEYDGNATGIWCPKKPGVYQIYADVKDVDGNIQTITKQYEVQGAPWKVENLDVDGNGNYFVGDTTTVTARLSGETDGLKFKFVQKNGNDWSDWKVLRDFDSNRSVEVTIKKEGVTTIYMDVMNQNGIVAETVTLTLKGQKLVAAKTSAANISLGKSVTISPQFSSSVPAAEYKYVWMKDNWKEWGVIKDFSSASSITWKPEALGQYVVYIDVRLHGVTQSKSVAVKVVRTAVDLNVPCYMQYPELPTGCESVALTNTLRYYGYKLSKTEMADYYIPRSESNFVTAFWGNPHSSKGNCCSAPAISNAANKYLKEKGSKMRAYDITGTSFQNFYEYLADGHPVIIWSTINAKPLGSCYATQNYNGKTYRTYTNSHTVVLKGYNREKNVVYIADSISGYTTESADWISFLYGARGMQAVVIS